MKKELFELTNPQKSIWLTEQYYKGSTVNNLCGRVNINEKIDFTILEKALNIVVKNNSNFLINFELSNGKLMQYLTEYKYINIETINVKDVADVEAIENSFNNKVFEIENSYLFEFKMFKFPDSTGGFVFCCHHLLGDSWSLGLIAKESIRAYNALISNSIDELPTSNYFDFYENENNYLSSTKFEKDKEYWDSVFSTVPEVASIPSKSKSSYEEVSCKANRNIYTLPKDTVEKISNFCKDNRVSAFNFLMSVYSLYISRVCNLKDFVIGTPILNRTNVSQKNTMGMFVSTAALRVNLEDKNSFIDLVSNVAQNSMSMLRHQKYPYEYLLKDLRKQAPNLPNLYNILISYQITKTTTDTIEHTTNWSFNGNSADEMQIHILDLNDTGSLNIVYDYKVQKYTSKEIEDIHKRILYIINQILNNSSILLNDIEIVTEEEKQNLISKEIINYKMPNSLIELIENIAKKNPNKIAIETDFSSITYAELMNRVNQTANYLLDIYNFKENSNIGVLTFREIDTIISILSILKINCTFVPIDPEYPIERIEYMIQNSKLEYILSSQTFDNNLDVKFIQINSETTNNYSSEFTKKLNYNIENNLYIVFTSGSTGKPKGIALKHKNMINLIFDELYTSKMFSKINTLRILQFATMSFDVSYQEIFTALLSSGTLVLINDVERKNIDKLTNFILNKQINVLFIPPAYLRLLVEKDSNVLSLVKTIKVVITAGEALIITEGIRKLLYNDIKLFNHYGPAETHVATTYLVHQNYSDINVPIGYPISNCHIYILDYSNNICPKNTIGQIVISGNCVGNGYWNNKALTQEKFIPDIVYGTDKMYLTGDLGYIDEDNCIHYIGRSDFQVKINGFRIEPDEINNVLLKYPAVENSVTIIDENLGKKHIICYYTSNVDNINETDIMNYLKKALPNYMIPTKLKELDKLPLTVNGKIDKKLLPKIDYSETNKEIKQANTETEKRLLKLWKNIFKLDTIGINFDFFELGGDSLLAIKLLSDIKDNFDLDLNISTIYSNPTIYELSKVLDSSITNSTKMKKIENNEFYPLSNAQRRIYYGSKMSSNPLVYNICGGLVVDTLLDEKKVNTIFNTLIKKHSSFRTCFKIIDNEPKQVVLDSVSLNIHSYKHNNIDIKELINSFPKQFNFENAPLLRVELHYIDEKKTLLLIDSHHIILDGTSLNILINEFCKLYNNESIEDEKIEYKDFTIWESEFNKSTEIKELEKNWLNIFKDIDIPVINLPYDFPVSQQKTYNGNTIQTKISQDTFEKLELLAKNNKVSPYVLFLSAFYALLYRYTGQDKIIVGSPISGRFDNSLENTIGMFVNNIPLLANIDSNLKFVDFMNIVKDNVINALDNGAYPYDMLTKALNLNANTSLFDVMFTYQSENTQTPKIEDKSLDIIYANTKTSKFNLSLEIIPNTNTLNLEYSTDLFKDETIKQFIKHYLNILENISNNLECKISDIEILSSEEKNKILYEFNNTKLDYPQNQTISELFEERVEKCPNKIAIVFEDKKLTFKELNEKSNELANYLRSQNIGRNDIIGIMVERSLELIVSILAALKCGCCYIPIDPHFPSERISYMLENSNAKILLTTEQTYSKTNYNKKLVVNFDNLNVYNGNINNLENINMPDDNSYIIYTSGSTGKPKGVVLKQKSLTNLAYHLNNELEFFKNPNLATMCSVTTASFDIFLFESIISLQAGLTVIIANEDEQRIPSKLNALIEKNNINAIQMTPSRMQFFLDNISDINHLKDLKYVILAGEPLSENLLQSLLNIGVKKIYNGYGPSETTVFSTFTDVTNQTTVTIGKPLSNTQLYILDKNMAPCPIGVPGELYISGDGVGNGYLNNIELTNKSYIENPFIKGSIMYKVGDLCKYTEGGNVLCLGRVDNQIKIRGLRIELGEIENRILDFPFIKKCVVVKQVIKNREFISAYYIAERRIRVSELRAFLAKTLPDYMIPSYFTALNNFPYTPNGKIDKKSLPLPSISKSDSINFVAPKTDLEIKLANIFENILSVNPIGIYDNFFELGGDSILAMKLNIELLKISNKITYSDIFDNPTISDLIKLLNNTKHIGTNLNNIDNTKYEELLNKNIILPTLFKKKACRNLLLTGSTGFLGIHVLDSYLQNNLGNVYCIIRNEPGISAKTKLINKLNYYFGEKYDDLIDKKIFIIDGDISKEKFGLTDANYYKLGISTDVVINCAAKVDHFGKYETFYNINVKGVQNLIDFCNIYENRFYQISTLSVSGNSFVDDYATEQNFKEMVDFNENNFYIGQTINNVYIRTKFEAEKLVLDSILNGLDGYILRVGNLMPRFKDGIFQENYDQNAYLSRLKAFLQIGCIPDTIYNTYLEFTPIDCCANAIVDVIQYPTKNNRIFHLFNHNHVYLNKLLEFLKDLNYKIDVIKESNFKEVIRDILNNDSKKSILNNLANDFGEDLDLNYESNIKIKSDFTIKYLNEINFKWPNIDLNYIENILKLIESR